MRVCGVPAPGADTDEMQWAGVCRPVGRADNENADADIGGYRVALVFVSARVRPGVGRWRRWWLGGRLGQNGGSRCRGARGLGLPTWSEAVGKRKRKSGA